MSYIVKLPGKDSKIYQEIKQNLKPLLHGTTLVIDCSIGSMASQPGWAVYKKGQLSSSGTLSIDPRGTKWERLRELHRQLRNLSQKHEPDICVFEQVPVSGHGGRSQVSHASLLYAVGVTMAAVIADAFIGVQPIVWKGRVREGYVKGDEQDAVEMGFIVIEIARVLSTEDPVRVYNKKPLNEIG